MSWKYPTQVPFTRHEQLLAVNNVQDVLACNAQPVFVAVATCLRQAPSLPYTDRVVENVAGAWSRPIFGVGVDRVCSAERLVVVD